MDALIRSARMASARMRLGKTSVRQVDEAGTEPATTTPSPEETLRAEIENQVRAELAAQMRDLYESERARARAEGHAAAVAEAQAAVAQDLVEVQEQLKSRAESAWAAIEQAHRAALAQLEASVGEVAFAAVCRLVGRKAASREFVFGLVEQTAAQLRTDRIATARMHPRDIATLHELLEDAELRIRSIGLKLIPDESLKLGGCMIEAPSGHYDGQLESQLRRLHAVLTERAPVDGATAPTASAER